MDTAVCHPLPDFLLSDYQSFPGREYVDILLFRIVPVNPHIRASKSIHNLAGPSLLVSLKEGTARLSFTARIEEAHSDCAASASKKDGLAAPSSLQARSFHSPGNGTRVGPTAAVERGPSTSKTSLKGSGQGCPLLRASREHILIVRPRRARRMVWLLPLPSKLARFTLPGTTPVLVLLRPSSEALATSLNLF